MPHPPKPEGEKLQYGVTTLFNQKDHDDIVRYARAHGIRKGQAIRLLVRKALDSTNTD